MTHYGDAIYEDATSRRRLRHGDTVLATVRTDRGSYFLALNPPENRVASTGFAMITPTKAPSRPAIYMEKDGRGWKEMRWDEKSLGI